MKIKFRKGYIEIQTDRFLYRYSKLTGTKGKAKAAAFFPFIFTTTKINPKMLEYFINHERIHFAQQTEKLFLGFWIIRLTEAVYYRLFKGKNAWNNYLLHSSEQEAYDNMFDLHYLHKRKYFSDVRKYLKYKPVSWKSIQENNLKNGS